MYRVNYQGLKSGRSKPALREESYAFYNKHPKESAQQYLLYIGISGLSVCEDMFGLGYSSIAFDGPVKAEDWLVLRLKRGESLPEAIICDAAFDETALSRFSGSLANHQALQHVPLILLSDSEDGLRQRKVVHVRGVDDLYFAGAFSPSDLAERIRFLKKFKEKLAEYPAAASLNPKSSPDLKRHFHFLLKRSFDIVVSAAALLVLTPFFFVIAILIRLESKGPVFYISKRVGTSYRIFNFFKFRTMYADADKRLKDLVHLNMYQENSGNSDLPQFIKIKDDPRITRLGRFLRNTSIDELPQLINVLRGDMSLVGNRPLPLYEAVNLTKDGWAKRFLAPAGITGLWQVTMRGKADASIEERIELDMKYADKVCFWEDMRIILKTFPALIQEENI